MKRFTSTAAVLFAAITMSASCSKGGENRPAPAGKSNVAIGIASIGGTRAIGELVADDTSANLVNGHIFFYTSTGIIDKHIALHLATGAAPSGFAITETIEDLKANKVVIEGVDGDVSRCLILFNVNGMFTSDLTGKTMSANVWNKSITAVAINDDASENSSTIDKVTLKGDEALTTLPSALQNAEQEEYTREVVMDVAAVGTRVQIGKIQATVYDAGTPSDTKDDVYITGYDVEGVFVNRVYNRMTLGAAYADAMEVDNGQVEDRYSVNWLDSRFQYGYGAGSSGEKLADNPATPWSAENGKVTPGTGKAWGYNLIPHAGATGVPHIVVKFSNIKYQIGTGFEQSLSGTKWITVKQYWRNAGNAEVTKFAPNQIYTIGNLDFNWADLKDLPETEDGAVRVSVTITPWNDNPVHWKN